MKTVEQVLIETIAESREMAKLIDNLRAEGVAFLQKQIDELNKQADEEIVALMRGAERLEAELRKRQEKEH